MVSRLDALRGGWQTWTAQRQISRPLPDGPFVLLHTLSHLLIEQVAMRCGYPASSLRERIYVDYEQARYALGLYTASSNAEGTLGGLVGQARHLAAHLTLALHAGALATCTCDCWSTSAAASATRDPRRRSSSPSPSASGPRTGPGERGPRVFYDPRALEPAREGAVLHVKAIVADDQLAFVISANLTEAAFERNIEAGIPSRDRALATALALHFQTLIDRRLLLPLPS